MSHYHIQDPTDPDLPPIPVDNVIEWCRTMESSGRHVGDDMVGDVRVSTVFLGLNHDHTGHGPPVLWETLIFGGPLDDQGERYTSRAAAKAGHARWVERVKAGAE